ncbi:MAG: gamma carbonic anhydrase family protein [Candidatus Accumulibacter sp.]|jgi:carbonic anhydrase/acetyltransferase-like protein (isoleucine patch superfamily)|nr:gamma carbonic anhydrase family protein [Accumulibacter sp.]
MAIYTLGDLIPKIDPESWIAPSADVIGQVTIGKNASVWWNCTVRGDVDKIFIGENTNIQDNSVVHTNRGIVVVIGNNVTVGHKVMLHGCSIGDNVLIGMGAVILNNAVIGKNSIVGAHSLVTEGKVFPEGSMIMGTPAKLVRPLTERELASLRDSADRYAKKWQLYRDKLSGPSF